MKHNREGNLMMGIILWIIIIITLLALLERKGKSISKEDPIDKIGRLNSWIQDASNDDILKAINNNYNK